jgi:hypothetical protein
MFKSLHPKDFNSHVTQTEKKIFYVYPQILPVPQEVTMDALANSVRPLL